MSILAQQLVGNDCTFELDEFQKPRLCSEIETVKNAVMFVLFAKPGQFPSIPYLGLDIRTILGSYYDEMTESELEERVISQCAALDIYFKRGDIAIKKLKYRGMPSLIINISTDPVDQYASRIVQERRRNNNVEFLIGLSLNDLNEMLINVNQRYVGRA